MLRFVEFGAFLWPVTGMTYSMTIMRNHLAYHTLSVALLLGLSGEMASAQSSAPPLTITKECAQAIRVAITGALRSDESAAWKKQHGSAQSLSEWMWSVLPHCGSAGGAVAATAWANSRSVSDTVRLAESYAGLWSFRDSSVFNAASSLAGNAAATPQSRVFSTMLVVAQLFDRWDPEYDMFISTGTYDVCRLSTVAGRTIVSGAPLPADARTRARALAQSLLASGSAPQAVKNAARCLDQAVEIDARLQAAGPQSIPPA